MTMNPRNAIDRTETTLSNAADRMADGVERGADRVAASAADLASATKRKVADVADGTRDVADASADAVSGAATRLGGIARSVQDTVVDTAGPALSALRDGAARRAEDARESLSDVGDRLAATLNRASEGDEADGLKSRVFTSVADGLTSASTALRERSVAEITADMKALARRHPGAFAAAAAIAGFAAARFIRASADRRAMAAQADRRSGPDA